MCSLICFSVLCSSMLDRKTWTTSVHWDTLSYITIIHSVEKRMCINPLLEIVPNKHKVCCFWVLFPTNRNTIEPFCCVGTLPSFRAGCTNWGVPLGVRVSRCYGALTAAELGTEINRKRSTGMSWCLDSGHDHQQIISVIICLTWWGFAVFFFLFVSCWSKKNKRKLFRMDSGPSCWTCQQHRCHETPEPLSVAISQSASPTWPSRSYIL